MPRKRCRKWLPVALLMLSSGVACSPGHVLETETGEPVTHYPGSLIGFSRHCANEHPHRVRAYALFASADGRARALLVPWAGYTGLSEEIGLGVRLESLTLDAGVQWVSQPYALRLEVRTGQGQWQAGAEVFTYHASEPGGPPLEQAFTTTPTGQVRWLTFIERDELEPGSDRSHRFAPSPAVPVRTLGLHDRETPVQLAMIVRNLESLEEIRMTGPSLRIPQRVWSMKPPAYRELDLVQSLNPLQEGGIAQAVAGAWRYRNCIDERRAAKREFRSFSAASRRQPP